MAKQDLSRHQEKIVKRYYENHETIQTQKLSELVSELWLAEDEKTLAKLWGKAEAALQRLGVPAERVAKVVTGRDLEALAKLATAADAGKVGPARGGGASAGGRPAVGDTSSGGDRSFGGGRSSGGAGGGSASNPATPGSAGSSSPGVPSQPGVTGHRGTPPGDGSAIKAMGARSAAEQPGGARTISQMRAEKAAASGYDSLESDNLKRAMKAFRRKLKNFRRDDESKLGSKYVTSGKTSGISGINPPSEFPPAVWDKLIAEGRLKRGGGGTVELP